MSILVCVMFGGYLWPSEARGLRFCDRAKPLRGLGSFYSLVLNPCEEGGLSKTCFLDESMLWDVPYLGRVPKVIECFSVGMAPLERSFSSVTCSSFVK